MGKSSSISNRSLNTLLFCHYAHGAKSRVSGVGIESNRPATNFPGISVDSNRFDCLADKSGLGVEFRRLERAIKQN
jgi:hypothetical protein